jgi:hypothetical protein
MITILLRHVAFALLLTQGPGLETKRLTDDQAEMLVRNVPDALAEQRRGACLSAEFNKLGANAGTVQLRNTCPRFGSGLIGNYVIDLQSGRIWSDIDRTKPVESPALRRLRNRLLHRPKR